MEIYYAIVNILDYLAKQKSRVYGFTDVLNQLAYELIRIGEGSSIQEVISSIADANDAGGCKTWEEIIDRFRELYKNGERVEV